MSYGCIPSHSHSQPRHLSHALHCPSAGKPHRLRSLVVVVVEMALAASTAQVGQVNPTLDLAFHTCAASSDGGEGGFTVIVAGRAALQSAVVQPFIELIMEQELVGLARLYQVLSVIL